MKFKVISPCSHCPFRKDVPGFLHPERAAELAEKLSTDDLSWFACHETTTSKGRSVRHAEAAQCAGQMIIAHKTGRPNVAMRIAYAAKLLRPGQLNVKAPVFDSFEEFAEHHKLAWEADREIPYVGRSKKRSARRRR